MRYIFVVLVALIAISSTSFSQQKLEDDVEIAFQNSKKGIYWALSNIPAKKAKLDNNLIGNDILLTNVKLSKEVNGVKVESVGYFHSNEVKIIVYKSNESLIKDGYITILHQQSRNRNLNKKLDSIRFFLTQRNYFCISVTEITSFDNIVIKVTYESFQTYRVISSNSKNKCALR